MKKLSLAALLIALALAITSCGGSSTTTTAASVKLSPSSELALNVGDIGSITAQVRDSDGTALKTQPTIYFSSSDPSSVTVSPSGSVCAGVWDATYVVCRPAVVPASTVMVTATVKDSTISASVPVSVHLKVDRIDLTTTSSSACVSQGESVQYKAVATHDGVDVTSMLGTITWSVSDSTVAQVNTDGLVVSYAPGVTSVYASASSVKSAPRAFLSCPAATIAVETTDGTPLSNVELTKGDSVTLIASVYDTKGNQVKGAPVTFTSSAPAVTRVNSSGIVTADVTALAAGPFVVLASCTPPTCNYAVQTSVTTPAGTIDPTSIGFNTPVYSNPYQGKVAGVSATSLYATGRSYTDGRTNYQLQVFDAGSLSWQTTIPLPHPSNSIVFDQKASKAYIGSPEGMTVLDTSDNTASSDTYTLPGTTEGVDIPGKVLAVSSAGKVFISDSDHGRTFVANTSGKTAEPYSFVIDSVTFSPDGYRTYASGPSGIYLYDSGGFHVLSTAGASAISQSPEGHIALATGTQNSTVATCNNTTSSISAPGTNFSGVFMDGPSPRFVGVSETQWVDIATELQATACTPVVQLSPTTSPYTQCKAGAFLLVPDGSYAVTANFDPQACSILAQIPYYRTTDRTTGTLSIEGSGTPISLASTLDSRFLSVGTSDGTIQVIDLQLGTVAEKLDLTFVPEAIAVAPK